MCGATSKWQCVYFSSKSQKFNIGVFHCSYRYYHFQWLNHQHLESWRLVYLQPEYHIARQKILHCTMMEQRVRSTLDCVNFVCTIIANLWTAHNNWHDGSLNWTLYTTMLQNCYSCTRLVGHHTHTSMMSCNNSHNGKATTTEIENRSNFVKAFKTFSVTY